MADPTYWLPGFYRSPQWRMLRAQYRLETGAVHDPRVDDQGVEVAMQLQVPPASSQRTDVPQDVLAAFELWLADETLRQLLEARLLTSQSISEIAAACSLSPEVVNAYHTLFFDVRERLHARDWVMVMAVRSHPLNDFDGPQPRGVWAYSAFTGGPRVLEAVVAVTLNQPFPAWLMETLGDNPQREEAYLRLKIKLALAIMTAKSSSPLGSLIELHQQLRDLEREAGQPVRDDPMIPVIGDILSMLERPRRSATPPRSRYGRKNVAVPRPAQPDRMSVPSTQGGNRED
jgi:hypothetical protein